VRQGYVSTEVAKSAYGAVLNGDGSVNVERTKAARKAR